MSDPKFFVCFFSLSISLDAFKVDLPESVKEAIVPRYSAIVFSVVENIHVALPSVSLTLCRRSLNRLLPT